MHDLYTLWMNLASAYSDDQDLIRACWLEMEESYSGKKRHYHNLSHLESMMEKVGPIRDKLAEPDAVLFAVFFHDVVYNAKRQDNEQQSADFARQRMDRLGVPTEVTQRCYDQIIATKEHQHSNDSDTNYLLDIDMAILGESPAAYKAYTEQVRKEYSIYPEFLYKPGRKKVLQHFLAMDRIFKTQIFHDQFDAQARKNIKEELKNL